MKKTSTIFLQVIVVLTGLGVIALLLWEPHLEGRNVNASTFDIYLRDPFLAYVYAGSVPFFIALYKAFRLLGYARHNMVFTTTAVKALRVIKYCMITTIGFVAGAEIFIFMNTSDDRAGGVFMGVLVTFGSIVIATAATVFERILQNAVDLKSENDLTI